MQGGRILPPQIDGARVVHLHSSAGVILPVRLVDLQGAPEEGQGKVVPPRGEEIRLAVYPAVAEGHAAVKKIEAHVVGKAEFPPGLLHKARGEVPVLQLHLVLVGNIVNNGTLAASQEYSRPVVVEPRSTSPGRPGSRVVKVYLVELECSVDFGIGGVGHRNVDPVYPLGVPVAPRGRGRELLAVFRDSVRVELPGVPAPFAGALGFEAHRQAVPRGVAR